MKNKQKKAVESSKERAIRFDYAKYANNDPFYGESIGLKEEILSQKIRNTKLNNYLNSKKPPVPQTSSTRKIKICKYSQKLRWAASFIESSLPDLDGTSNIGDHRLLALGGIPSLLRKIANSL